MWLFLKCGSSGVTYLGWAKWVWHPWQQVVNTTIHPEDHFLRRFSFFFFFFDAKNVDFIFVLRCQWQLEHHSSPQRKLWLIVQCLISHTDTSAAPQDGCIMTELHHALIIVPAVTVLTFHYFLSVFPINLLISEACKRKHKEPKLTNRTTWCFHLVAFSTAMAATCVHSVRTHSLTHYL